MKKLYLAIIGISVAGFMSGAKAAEPYVGYRVTAVKTLPGKTPRWDHVSVDPVNRHLFIGRRHEGLTVINIDTGEVSSVAETTATNGATAAADLGLGFSDQGTASDVAVFDLKTLQVKGHIKMPFETDGVFYDPVTKMGYVNNGEKGSITFFDPIALKVGVTVDLGTKKPEFSDVNGKGRAFVVLQDKNAVAVVDTKTQKLEATWPVNCQVPTGLMYEPASDRLFIACRGDKPVLAVVDADSGKTVATVAIGVNADAVAFYPAQKLVLVPNGNSANMSVIKQDSPDSYHLVESVATRLMARTMALDPKTGKAFTVAPESTQPAAPPGGKQPAYISISNSFQVLTLEYGPIE